jgi:hypothetical protein
MTAVHFSLSMLFFGINSYAKHAPFPRMDTKSVSFSLDSRSIALENENRQLNDSQIRSNIFDLVAEFAPGCGDESENLHAPLLGTLALSLK